ncbi:hypothetical protein Pla175_03230 [Pirellulimonas nuda]|uniref:Uncharacterized protein n=1 Tax=Pirellulimonas nuda TaxID=2528009 RepID=A0A518D684_9BACT|nr:hypothetical protein [Pirellulimonas nuda]QDU86969.1 hypothetical protein Pla175_03230 [Pirellulimonas nuda]
MSTPTPTADERTRRYLIRQLQRNPWEAADQIVASRAKALGQQPKVEQQSSVDPAEQRRAAREGLDAVRAACFTGDAAQLSARLDALPLADLPDLRAAADRLRVILASRKDLPALSQQPGFDGDFFECFKQVLVKPARETTVMRERVLASTRQRKLRRRLNGMIALMEREMPQLCALERDWLTTLTASRPVLAAFGSSRLSSIVIATLLAPLVLIVVFCIVVGTVVFISGLVGGWDSSGAAPPSTYPSTSGVPGRSSSTAAPQPDRGLEERREEMERFRAESEARRQELLRKVQELKRPEPHSFSDPLPGGFGRPRHVPVPEPVFPSPRRLRPLQEGEREF